jgi:cell division protein FtsB
MAMESEVSLDYSDLEEDELDTAPSWQQRMRATLRRPLALVLFGVALVGLLALLYLSEVAGVEATNAQLRAQQDQQARLERQEAQLRERLGVVTSPAYIEQRARALGLVPASGAPIFIVRMPNGAYR